MQVVQLFGLVRAVVKLDVEEDRHAEKSDIRLQSLVDLCVENDDDVQKYLFDEDYELPVEEGSGAESITHIDFHASSRDWCCEASPVGFDCINEC